MSLKHILGWTTGTYLIVALLNWLLLDHTAPRLLGAQITQALRWTLTTLGLGLTWAALLALVLNLGALLVATTTLIMSYYAWQLLRHGGRYLADTLRDIGANWNNPNPYNLPPTPSAQDHTA